MAMVLYKGIDIYKETNREWAKLAVSTVKIIPFTIHSKGPSLFILIRPPVFYPSAHQG